MEEKQLKQSKKNEPFSEKEKANWEALEEVEEYANDLSGRWVQRGAYLVNEGAKLRYGVYVGIDKMLVGVGKDGKPLLKSKKDWYKGFSK